MVLVYKNEGEVIVCNPFDELQMLRIWFASDSGRSLDDYERCESDVAVSIGLSFRINSE